MGMQTAALRDAVLQFKNERQVLVSQIATATGIPYKRLFDFIHKEGDIKPAEKARLCTYLSDNGVLL